MKKTFRTEHLSDIAKELLGSLSKNDGATVIALSGDLGAGKTTLSQEIARQLGIDATVISPTFVIMKEYPAKNGFTKLVHIDAYRLNSGAEMERLGWDEILKDPETLVLVEWPERILDVMPSTAHKVSLSHITEEEREIEF